MEITVQELAARLGGTVHGNSALLLRGIATIQSAGEGDVTFLANKRYARYLASTCASAVIVSVAEEVGRDELTVIRVNDPYLGFLNTLKWFHAEEAAPTPGVDPSAVIADDATIDATASIGPNAVIGAGAIVGSRSAIGAGCVLTENVTIGDDCLLHPNVTVLARAAIGNNVIIHSGATIGSDGFGYAPSEGRYEKIPQIGSVVIEDNVEIGANTTIDRGTIGNTIIGEGTKIDNLVQIAHNVEIGTNTVVAAQSGISGSTRLGNNVIIAGQVGLVGHIDIGDGVTITAQSGVSKSVYGEGRTFRGSPAREIHEELKQEAAIRQLPDMIAAVRKLEKRISGLEKGSGETP